MKTASTKSSVITQIALAAVAIILSYLLLFSQTMQVTAICQILCGGIIAVGIISIISYFVSGDFKRIDRYGFALGVMLVLMGIIGLVRIEDLTTHFDIYAGLLSLILGVLVLQGTVQVKVLDYPVWILNLILTIGCLGGAFCVLSEITVVTQLVAGFANWVLLICGICCLFSMAVTWICILLAGRREKKAAAEKEKEAQAQQANPAPETQEPPVPQPGAYQPAQETYEQQPAADPAVKPSEPAETHHTVFDASTVPQDDFPPVESPQLVFDADEGHHSSYDPGSNP